MNYKPKMLALHTYALSGCKKLVIHHEDQAGFEQLRLVDEDGDFMSITMHELLNAISAVYYSQKKRVKK